jgi:hypothetical protein
MKAAWSVATFLFVLASAAVAGPLLASNDNQIRQQIIRQSIAEYQATGHPCVCPYNVARNGSRCCARSAYIRPGGARPLCYPSDVSHQMVSDWKRQHATGGQPDP